LKIRLLWTDADLRGVLLVSILSAATKGGTLTTKLILQSEGNLVQLQAIEALASTASALLGGVASDVLPRRLLMPFTNGFLFVITLALAFGGDPAGFYAAYALGSPLGILPLSTWFKEQKGVKRWPTRVKDGLENVIALATPFAAQALYKVFGRTVIAIDAMSFLFLAIAGGLAPQAPRETPRQLNVRGAWQHMISDRRVMGLWVILNLLFAFSDVITAFNNKEADFLASYFTLETAGRIIAVLTLISRSGEGSRGILFQQSLQSSLLIALLLPMSSFAIPVEVRAIHSVMLGIASSTAWFGLYELLLGDAPLEVSGMCAALNRMGFNLISMLVKAPLMLVPVALTAIILREIAMTACVASMAGLVALAIYTSSRPK
jgi:hypothetical protein